MIEILIYILIIIGAAYIVGIVASLLFMFLAVVFTAIGYVIERKGQKKYLKEKEKEDKNKNDIKILMNKTEDSIAKGIEKELKLMLEDQREYEKEKRRKLAEKLVNKNND